MMAKGMREALLNMGLAEKDIRNLARQATHAIASTMTKRAKRNAPRDTGRLVRATKPKRRRAWPDLFRSGTYVEMGQSREDTKGAYYWRFVEQGTKYQGAQEFIGKALKETASEAISIFNREVMDRGIKLMKKRAK